MIKRFLILLLLSGCANMTPEQKRDTAIYVGAAVIAGAIIASKDDRRAPPDCYAIVPPGAIERRICWR